MNAPTERPNDDLALSTLLLLTSCSWYAIVRWVLVPLSVLVLGEW